MPKSKQMTIRDLMQKILDPRNEIDLDAPICVDVSSLLNEQENDEEDDTHDLSVPLQINDVEFRGGELVLVTEK